MVNGVQYAHELMDSIIIFNIGMRLMLLSCADSLVMEHLVELDLMDTVMKDQDPYI